MNRKRITKFTALLMALLMVLSLYGCGKDDDVALHIGLTGLNTVPAPAMVATDSERIVVSHLYENLMKLASDGEGGVHAVSAQARSFHCEDELDGTQTYTFTLRDDLTWSDGQHVTAGDFVYAWQRLVDPATKSPNAFLLSVVAGYDQARSKNDPSLLQVTAEDDKTLVVKLNCRCPYFLSSVCTAAATMPVRADGVVATNGIYCLASQENNHLLLTARSDYYDKKRVYTNALSFTFCQTAAELSALYDEGNLDFMLAQPGEGTAETAIAYPRTGVLLINQSAPGMKSESLRQALSLVIDRNAMVEGLTGAYTAADGLVSSGIPAEDGNFFRDNNGALIDNDADHYADNCAAAHEKMVEAGYDSDTAMAALGKLTLLYERGEKNEKIVSQLCQAWQDELKLTVTPVATDDMTAALKKGEFTLALTDVTGYYNDATSFLNTFRSTASENYGRFRSTAYDMLLRVAATSSSDEARMAYLEDAERLLLEKGGVIPLYGYGCNAKLREGLAGLVSNGVGVYYFANVTTAAR